MNSHSDLKIENGTVLSLVLAHLDFRSLVSIELVNRRFYYHVQCAYKRLKSIDNNGMELANNKIQCYMNKIEKCSQIHDLRLPHNCIGIQDLLGFNLFHCLQSLMIRLTGLEIVPELVEWFRTVPSTLQKLILRLEALQDSTPEVGAGRFAHRNRLETLNHDDVTSFTQIQFPDLTEFYLIGSIEYILTETAREFINGFFPLHVNLETVHITRFGSPKILEHLASLRNLSSLTMEWIKFNEASCQSLSESCCHLTELKFNKCVFENRESLKRVIIPAKHLRKLFLSCKFNLTTIGPIFTLPLPPTLVDLHFDDWWSCNSGLRCITLDEFAADNLKRLTLISYDNTQLANNIFDFGALIELNIKLNGSLRQCQNSFGSLLLSDNVLRIPYILKKFVFSSDEFVNDRVLRNIAFNFPHLIHIELNDIGDITKSGMDIFCKQLVHLKSASITFVDVDIDLTILGPLLQLPNMVKLGINGNLVDKVKNNTYLQSLIKNKNVYIVKFFIEFAE